MDQLTPSQTGAVAEAEIAAAVIRLKLLVLRPLSEGGRYDLLIDTGEHLLRVQCKWASRQGEVLSARRATCRHTPAGYRRSTYSAREVDAIAVYSPHTDCCYLIPIDEVEGRTGLSLRLSPTANNQARRIHWATDYELVASLRRNWSVSELPDAAKLRPSSRPLG